jgi:hypothetical protein
MSERGNEETSKRCVALAGALAIAHFLTLIGVEYQLNWRPRFLVYHPFVFFVNYGIFLSPLVVIFAFRRVCIVLGILAIPILTFFTFRMSYVWEFYWFGINSMDRQKGDALGFINMVFDMLSILVAVPFLLFMVGYKLIESFQRIRRRPSPFR